MNKIGIIGAGTKIYYDIVQSDPENVGISGFTAHYLRMAEAFPCFLQFLFRLRLRFNPYVGDRARKKRKINIRGVLIELLGFHV